MDSPHWIKYKKATTHSINDDDKYFQYMQQSQYIMKK